MGAAGAARLAVAIKLLEATLPLFGSASEPGQAILSAIGKLSKHAPANSVPPGVETSTLQALLAKQQQMAPQIAAMRAQQAPQGGAPQPPQPAAA